MAVEGVALRIEIRNWVSTVTNLLPFGNILYTNSLRNRILMRVLVTGASGLIGSHLVRSLVESGHEVISVGRKRPTGPGKEVVEHIPFDFERDHHFEKISEAAGALVHLAQSPNFRDFPSNSREVFSTNVQSTIGLLQWARTKGVRHFIYASTGGLYSGPGPFVEGSTPLKTPGELDLYFSTKLASEAFVQCYSGEFSVAVMRFFFVYGPKQNRKMLLPRIFDRIQNGEEIFLDGEEGLRLNPIHVSDAGKTIQESLNNPRTMVTNVAGPEVLSLREASEIIGSHLRKRPRFVITGKPVSDVVGDTSYMFENLFKSTRTLSEMVADLGI